VSGPELELKKPREPESEKQHTKPELKKGNSGMKLEMSLEDKI
jgi:hypothetical protein